MLDAEPGGCALGYIWQAKVAGAKTKCWNCELGHFSKDCPKPKKEGARPAKAG